MHNDVTVKFSTTEPQEVNHFLQLSQIKTCTSTFCHKTKPYFNENSGGLYYDFLDKK